MEPEAAEWVQRARSGQQPREQTTRPLRVLQLLRVIEQEPRRGTRAALAERFGVSERMMDKDLAVIRLAGFDLRRHAGGYSLHDAAGEEAAVRREQVQEREEEWNT